MFFFWSYVLCRKVQGPRHGMKKENMGELCKASMFKLTIKSFLSSSVVRD